MRRTLTRANESCLLGGGHGRQGTQIIDGVVGGAEQGAHERARGEVELHPHLLGSQRQLKIGARHLLVRVR